MDGRETTGGQSPEATVHSPQSRAERAEYLRTSAVAVQYSGLGRSTGNLEAGCEKARCGSFVLGDLAAGGGNNDALVGEKLQGLCQGGTRGG